MSPKTSYRHSIGPASDGESFGRWLLAQVDRGDWIDDLATAARADRKFLRDGSPEDVVKHLRDQQAEGDMFQALEDAKTNWRAY